MKQRIDTVEIQEEQALLLRKNGLSLQQIADATGLTKGRVHTLSKRIKDYESDVSLADRIESGGACRFCGTPIVQTEGVGRPRRFCSDHCRRQYWRLHRSEQKRNPAIVYTRTCKYCGEPFEVYGKNDRKYCCRDHYLKHFYGEDYGKREDKRIKLIRYHQEELSRLMAEMPELFCEGNLCVQPE